MTRSTFLLPTLIALATLTGILVALTGDGWRDALAWIALATPVAAVTWAHRRRPVATRSSRRPARPARRTIAS